MRKHDNSFASTTTRNRDDNQAGERHLMLLISRGRSSSGYRLQPWHRRSNAGIEHFNNLPSVTSSEIDCVFAVNTKGQFFVAQQSEKHKSGEDDRAGVIREEEEHAKVRRGQK
ncbi:hypothetical protein VTI74DRAFT_4491 [Chaetomium olivicolor]